MLKVAVLVFNCLILLKLLLCSSGQFSDILSEPNTETTLTDRDFELGQFVTTSSEPENVYLIEDLAGKFEGDIKLESVSENPTLNDVNFNAINDFYAKWPSARVPYKISSQYGSRSRSVIASAINEYGISTCIRFKPAKNSDRNYVSIIPDDGCYSMDVKEVVSIGDGCVHKGIIIHELMHVVGFFHEQSRSDRDEYVDIKYNNIKKSMAGQFVKYRKSRTQDFGAKYDYSSIMHYGKYSFSKNGSPTIVPKQNAAIGQHRKLSDTDLFKLQRMYESSNAGLVTNGLPVWTWAPVKATPKPWSPWLPLPPDGDLTRVSHIVNKSLNHRKPLVVTFELMLRQIVDVRESDQAITTKFIDTSGDYDDVTSIRTQSDQVWSPDITLSNRVSAEYSDSPIITIKYDGKVSWSVGATLTSICKMDLRNFSFDTQSHNIDDLGIKSVSVIGDSSAYTESGEWELISHEILENQVQNPSGRDNFAALTVRLVI